jgi:hypothetical protein
VVNQLESNAEKKAMANRIEGRAECTGARVLDKEEIPKAPTSRNPELGQLDGIKILQVTGLGSALTVHLAPVGVEGIGGMELLRGPERGQTSTGKEVPGQMEL